MPWKHRQSTDVRRESACAGGKALIVEDDYAVLQLMRLLLEDAGFDVLLARGASDALSIVKATSDSITLAIIDLNLPGFDGRQLALQLGPLVPEARILFASGAPAEDVAGLPIVSDESFLRKPFSHAEFRAKVGRLLSHETLEGAESGAHLALVGDGGDNLL